MEIAGLHKICSFNASEPGQSEKLAGSQSLLALPLSDKAGWSYVGLDAQLKAGLPVSVSAFQRSWTLVAHGPNFPEVFESLQ